MIKKILMFFVLILLVAPFVCAGIGIKTSRESLLVDESSRVCLKDYAVYNPWEDPSYVNVEVSGELEQVLDIEEMEPILVPAYTMHDRAIPVAFRFNIPEIYDQDSLVGEMMFCEQTCEVEQKVYSGEIVISSVPSAEISGAGGSITTMSVSAPLNLKVRCDSHLRSYTPAYIVLAIISIGAIMFFVYLKYRKPKTERDKDKIEKLQSKIKKLKKG